MRPFRTCCMMMLAMMMILFACAPADAGCGLFSGMRARRAARQQAAMAGACGATGYSSYQSYQSYGYAAPVQTYYGVQQGAVCAPCGQSAPAPTQQAPMILQPAPGVGYRTIYSVPMQAQMDCSNGTCTLRR